MDAPTVTGKPSSIALEGRGGSITFRPVEVIGETPTKYKILLVEDIKIPGYRRYKKDETFLAPKHVVTYRFHRLMEKALEVRKQLGDV